MDGRLASIEQLLRGLSSQTPSTPRPESSIHTPSSQINDGQSRLIHSVGTGPSVDLVAAKELFEQTVGACPKIQHSVAEALQALQGIVGRVSVDVDAETSHIAATLQTPTNVVPPCWPQIAEILEKAGGEYLMSTPLHAIPDRE